MTKKWPQQNPNYKHPLELEIERLREIVSRIRVAAEFHAQQGIADHVMRYAHESTVRLCDEALGSEKRDDD